MTTTSRMSLKHSLRMLLPLLCLLGILALVIMACGDSSANAGTSVGTNGGSNQNTSSSNSSKHFKVGDQVKVGDTFIVTINSIKTSKGDDFDQPKSGDTYVVIDMTIKNVSNEEQDISTDLQCTLKDSTGQKYDQTILSSATPPDGKLAAGDVVKGQIAYEVPTSQHNFTLAFEADIVSGGQTIWDLHI